MADIKQAKWFARVDIDGHGESMRLQGTILQMTQQFLQHISQTTIRSNPDSRKQITFTLSNVALDEDSISLSRKAQSVLDHLDDSLVVRETPFDGEDILSFTHRLINAGYNYGTAAIIAADSFGYEPPADLHQWLTDPQAIKFRALHASQAAFESADPHELKILETHCCRFYPDYVSKMRLRA